MAPLYSPALLKGGAVSVVPRGVPEVLSGLPFLGGGFASRGVFWGAAQNTHAAEEVQPIVA